MSLLLRFLATPPAPPAPPPPLTNGGDPWWDRVREPSYAYMDEDGNFTIREEVVGRQVPSVEPGGGKSVIVERPRVRHMVGIPRVQAMVAVPTVHAHVETPRKTMQQNPLGLFVVEETCDPGQPVTVTVSWEVHPTEVYFLYLPPGEEIAIVDDGFGQPQSRIECLASEPEVYRASFSTAGFEPGGVVWWKFWGETDGKPVVAKYGKIRINTVPATIA